MGMWLTPEEVVELTALKRWCAQRTALVRMGIQFIPNRVGRPLVARTELEPATEKIKRRASQEPNW